MLTVQSLKPDPGAVGSCSWSRLPLVILCSLYTLVVAGGLQPPWAPAWRTLTWLTALSPFLTPVLSPDLAPDTRTPRGSCLWERPYPAPPHYSPVTQHLDHSPG